MPELPEVEALAAFLRENAVGHVITRVDLAGIQAIKTFDPPLTALGRPRDHRRGPARQVPRPRRVRRAPRRPPGAGRLAALAQRACRPPRPSRARARWRCGSTSTTGEGFDLTEQGTRKGLAVYVVRSPSEVPGIARLGPDALEVDQESFARLMAGRSGQLKGALTDQTLISGIGNAYSDEILHAARLSPFKMADKLTGDELIRLFDAMRATLTDALDRQVGQKAATLKGEKRSGLTVHARTGLPCPVCGDTVREVSFADTSLQYCPTCQTGGKPLADRRMSKLLR